MQLYSKVLKLNQHTIRSKEEIASYYILEVCLLLSTVSREISRKKEDYGRKYSLFQ